MVTRWFRDSYARDVQQAGTKKKKGHADDRRGIEAVVTRRLHDSYTTVTRQLHDSYCGALNRKGTRTAGGGWGRGLQDGYITVTLQVIAAHTAARWRGRRKGYAGDRRNIGATVTSTARRKTPRGDDKQNKLK